MILASGGQTTIVLFTVDSSPPSAPHQPSAHIRFALLFLREVNEVTIITVLGTN